MGIFDFLKRDHGDAPPETYIMGIAGHVHTDETACVVMSLDKPISRADATTILATALAINISHLRAGERESESLRVHEIIANQLEETAS